VETQALLPVAIHWPQKTVGTQAYPNEGITDPVVASWLQPLGGSRLRQLRGPPSCGEEVQRAGEGLIRSRGLANPNSSSFHQPQCYANALSSSNGT